QCMFRLMKNIYLQIPLNKPDIPDLAIATVIRTEGSTPQKPGSSAIFNRSGLVAGTVGGGVLEGKVQMIAMESLETKEPVHQIFRLDTSVSDGEDALCGGRINILIDPEIVRHKHVFEALAKSSKSRIPGVLLTFVTDKGDNKILIKRYWATNSDRSLIPDELKPLVEPEISSLISGNDSYDFRELKIQQYEKESSHLLFLEPIIPSPRLLIAGAGHISKALSQIGSMLDFEVTVIDDRSEFANSENIPFANHIINGDIGDAMEKIEKGDDTYIVIVTRGHREDGRALRACIGSDAAYIGMIGSKTKIALMHREFIENRWATEEQWERIFAPIGLDIRSKTVEEIAVSIAAQLIQVKNNR
ncbi:MAG: XdhC/CoxI family protein, partial [Bacteroidia bacterium]